MKKNGKEAFVFLLPTLLIIVGLVFYPIIKTFRYSIQNYKLTEPENIKNIGLKNYFDILKSQPFWDSVVNTAVIVGVVLVVGLSLSLIVALILNCDFKFNGILTAVAIIPWALPPVVNGIVWKFIFYPEYGFLNKLLFSMGLIHDSVRWLDSRFGTLIIVGLIVAWRVIPFCAIVFLANMRSIPKEIYEAAKVDGATGKHIFASITLPLLMPSVMVVLMNLTMSAINVFDDIVALVGFRDMSQSVLIYNYNQTFSFLNLGYGSAITYIIMIGSGILGYLYICGLNRGMKGSDKA